MNKAKLQELCQKRRWELPQYKHWRLGTDEPRFSALVTVNRSWFKSPDAESRSAKEARNKAAAVALETLSNDVSAAVEVLRAPSQSPAVESQSPLPPHTESHGTYKTQLLVYAQKRGKGQPKYTTVNDGSPHAPRFKATVLIDGISFVCPKYFKKQKEAEHAAAEVALASLPKEESSQQSLQNLQIIIKPVIVVKRGSGTSFLRSEYLLCQLQNPCGSSPQYVILDCYEDTPNSNKSIRLMQTLSHQSILKCHFSEKVSNTFEVLTDDITASLNDVYKNNFDLFHIKGHFPSRKLSEIFRSIVEVLIFLHEHHEYHGALFFDSLPYVNEHGNEIVKLANFKEKKGTTERGQLADWRAVGYMLEFVLTSARGSYPDGYFSDLEEAMQYFKDQTIDTMPNISRCYGELQFFWRVNDRRKFAMHIYLWVVDQKCCDVLRTTYSKNVRLPWNVFKNDEDLGNAILSAMNAFRKKDEKNASDYNGQDIVDFLKFFSGVYTHCDSLKEMNLSLCDCFILSQYQGIFSILKAIQKKEGFA